MPPFDPDVANIAPTERALTPYDQEHAITYMRMLDTDAELADRRDVSRIVLHIDPDQDLQRARRAFDSHLARAQMDVARRIQASAPIRTSGRSEQGCTAFGFPPQGQPTVLEGLTDPLQMFDLKAAAAAEVHRAACSTQGTRGCTGLTRAFQRDAMASPVHRGLSGGGRVILAPSD
jgi:hypothetical protein